MNMITLFDNFMNRFNEVFTKNSVNLENEIMQLGDNFSIELFVKIIEDADIKFRDSLERKQKYSIKAYHNKNLVTTLGIINFIFTRYQDKNTNKSYTFIRDFLKLKPYQRMTDEAEHAIVKYAMENNMSKAAKNALRNVEICRSTVSKKLAKLDGTPHLNIEKCKDQPKILFIEMDEIHANLQIKGNKGPSKNHICPCAIVHEGYTEKTKLAKRKELKNVKNFASAKLDYKDLWEVIYDYVDKKYDIDSFDYMFVSGDGAAGIKEYSTAFPNAIFVLDKFHYKKALKYIFKDKKVLKIADEYIRNDKIEDFKTLVNIEIEKRPYQKDELEGKMNYIINNIEGIKNQKHKFYICPCSMEGHVSNKYARFITTSPYAFSLRGLENKLKLLVMHADNHTLTFNEYLDMKYGTNEYQDILEKIYEITHIKNVNTKDFVKCYEPISTSLPRFEDISTNDYLSNLIANRTTFKFQ